MNNPGEYSYSVMTHTRDFKRLNIFYRGGPRAAKRGRLVERLDFSLRHRCQGFRDRNGGSVSRIS
jgi:hypothetical protein